MTDPQPLDVVVIGGGLAGLAAAVRSAELGARVAVLEKGARPDYPCNTRFSGGIFHVAYQDPKMPPEELRRVIDDTVGAVAEPRLRNMVAQNAGRTVDWLRDRGIQFARLPLSHHSGHAWAVMPPRPLSAGLDWVNRGPDLMLQLLTRRLTTLGGILHLGVRAESLLVESEQCVGVRGRAGGQLMTWSAPAVVVADGGYQADLDRLRHTISPAPERMKQRGAATGAGDGLRMAEALGAATTDMSGFYGHLLSRDALSNDRLWPYPELDLLAATSIVVDKGGKRFMDEGGGGVHMANVLAKHEDPLTATIIFDTAIWEGAGRGLRIPANPHLEKAGGTIFRAYDIASLASMAGMPPETLSDTVQRYNAALAGGTLGDLNPPRSIGRAQAQPIAVAPFYAVPVCSGITYTMGGLRIDEHARVLRADGRPIVGLYAAGSAAGGFEGGPRTRYLGGLIKAGILGLVAAETIARIQDRGTVH